MQIQQLADQLGIQKRAIIATANRLGVRSSELQGDALTLVLDQYSKPNPNRKPETIEAANRLLQSLSVRKEIGKKSEKIELVEISDDEPATASPIEQTAPIAVAQGAVQQVAVTVNLHKKAAETSANGKSDCEKRDQDATKATKTGLELKKSQWANTFLYFVFICALGWQMGHSAWLESSISRIETDWVRSIAAWGFAFAVQFTALLLTIRKGNKSYLQGFAMCEFCINLLYYRPWSGGVGGTDAAAQVLLSAVIAFTIYSYAELFTDKI